MCVQADNFLARTSGLNFAHTHAYNEFICGLVSDNVWSKLDALYLFYTADATTASLNLVSSSFTITVVGTPTFTADAGYVGHDLATPTNYLNTGFTPSTAGGNFSQNSAHLAVWLNTIAVPAAGGSNIGAQDLVSGPSAMIAAAYTDSKAYFRMGQFSTAGITSVVLPGLYVSNRSDASTRQQYQPTQGSGSGSPTTASDASAPLQVEQVYILARNYNGGPLEGSADQVAMASIGGSLTQTDVNNLYNRFLAYQLNLTQGFFLAEEQPLPSKRRVWKPRSFTDEFLRNPTQTVFANWGFDEPRQREPQPVRRRIHLNQTDPNEFLLNPTQTVFARWGFDEPRQREPHPVVRPAWRARPLPLSDEFLRNPTQTAFVNWGFDEPPLSKLPRTRWHSREQPDDTDIGPKQLVGVSWSFDEPPFQRIVKTRWHSRSQPDDTDIGFTQLVGVPWGFEPEQREPHPILRRRWQAHSQPLSDEFLLNPTQTVFASWGFDEPPFQRIVKTRWHSREQADDTDIGAKQLVGVPWGFDEPPLSKLPRTRWHSRAEAPHTDFGVTQLVGVNWGFDEPAFQHIVRTRWHSRSQPDTADIGAVQLVGVAWGFDEPAFQKLPKLRWHSRAQPDDTDIGAVQLVGVPWGFDQPAFQRLVRTRWHSRLPPDDTDIGTQQQIVGIPWGFDEPQYQHIVRSRWYSRAQPDEAEPIGSTQLVGVPWGFDEPQYQALWRARWHSRAQPDDTDIGSVQLVGVPWGFDEDRQRVPRRQANLNLIAQDEFLISVSQVVTVVAWGFEEEQHRLERRRVHLNQTQPDEFLFNPTQIVFVPWGAFDEQSRVGRRSWRPRSSGDEPSFPQPAIPPAVWSELDQWMRRPRISQRRLIEQLEFFQGVPPGPPPPAFIEWEDIRGVRRRRWHPNALVEFWDVFIPIIPPTLRQPTGHNFRASPGQPSPANFPPGVPPQLNEPGVTLYLSVGDGDLSPARLIFTKPSGTTYTVGVPLIYLERPTPTPGGIFQGGTYAIYTFAGDELDELGVWRVQITRGSGKTSGPSIFTVVRNVSM